MLSIVAPPRRARLSIEEHLPQVRSQRAALAGVGIDDDQVTRQIQEEEGQTFLDFFRTLFACIAAKREGLQA